MERDLTILAPTTPVFTVEWQTGGRLPKSEFCICHFTVTEYSQGVSALTNNTETVRASENLTLLFTEYFTDWGVKALRIVTETQSNVH